MVVTTIVRWYLLVRALELPFTLRDAFRLGFLGFLFNFVSLGSVGGDFFKAIFIAREQHGHRAEAVATVVIDRIIGLYALFLVASAAVLITGLFRSPVREIQIICNVTLILTVVGAAGIGLLLMPGFTNGRLSAYVSNLPYVGHVTGRLLNSVRVYRSKLPVLIVTTLMSVGVHCLTTIALFLVSRGLPGVAPGFGAHFLCVPLAVLASAMPLPLSGLGAMEAVLDFLYVHVPSRSNRGGGDRLDGVVDVPRHHHRHRDYRLRLLLEKPACRLAGHARSRRSRGSGKRRRPLRRGVCERAGRHRGGIAARPVSR